MLSPTTVIVGDSIESMHFHNIHRRNSAVSGENMDNSTIQVTVTVQQNQPQATTIPPKTPSEPTRPKGPFIIVGLLIALSGLVVVGVWAYYAYFDQSTPKGLLKGYFNSISLKRYDFAWNKVDQNSNSTMVRNGKSQFIQEWEERKNIVIRSIDPLNQQGTLSGSFSVKLVWLRKSDDAKFCDDVQCEVGRKSENDSWEVINCLNRPKYAPPSPLDCWP